MHSVQNSTSNHFLEVSPPFCTDCQGTSEMQINWSSKLWPACRVFPSLCSCPLSRPRPQPPAMSQAPPPSQSLIPTLLPQPPISASQRQLLLPREFPGPCPLSGIPTFEGMWLFPIVEEWSSTRVGSLYPDTGTPSKLLREERDIFSSRCDYLPVLKEVPATNLQSLKTEDLQYGLRARLTYRELGFLWPSHWGGCAPTSSAEGSLFPLRGTPPFSSWVSWHFLESQNALQPASWWLPEIEPAAPEGVKDGR